MSTDVLSDMPFTSFTVSGLILGTMVGGGMTIAAILAWMQHRYSCAVGLVAGGTLSGWMLIETSMLQDGRVLRAAVLLWATAFIPLTRRTAGHLGGGISVDHDVRPL
jgi:hypothetical protein